MGSDSGRQPGAGSSCILRGPPAQGALVLPGGWPLSRGQAGGEGAHLPDSPGLRGGGSSPPTPQHALTEEAQLPEPSGYKTDGDQRRCQQTARVPFTKSNLFLFPSPSSSPTSQPPLPLPAIQAGGDLDAWTLAWDSRSPQGLPHHLGGSLWWEGHVA